MPNLAPINVALDAEELKDIKDRRLTWRFTDTFRTVVMSEPGTTRQGRGRTLKQAYDALNRSTADA